MTLAPKPSICPPEAKKGFSLVELMVALAILAIASVGAFSLLYQSTRMYTHGTFRLMTNADIRKFTDEIDSNAVSSNYFLIYPSFPVTATQSAVAKSQAGDCVVFVFRDASYMATATLSTASSVATESKIKRIVCYFRVPTLTIANVAGQVGALYKYDLTLGTSTTASVVSLLPTSTTQGTILMNNSTGTVSNYFAGACVSSNSSSSASSNSMFYNFNNVSVVVKRQIIFSESNNESPRTASTYNFTISPRG